jgi:transposase InsO family protein
VHRLYVEERLQIRRRRRKKVPMADRQPLVRPAAPNEVWSADFVFDCTAEGRVLKCLAIVDDATTEAVALVPARALGGMAVTRCSTAWRSPEAFRACSGPTTASRSADERC